MNQNVLKTREKKVVTMDIGAFRAKETVLQSREDRAIYTCQDLKALAPQRKGNYKGLGCEEHLDFG